MKHFNVKMVSWATSTFTRTYRAHHLFALSTLELTGNCMSSSVVRCRPLGHSRVSTLTYLTQPIPFCLVLKAPGTRDLGGGKNCPGQGMEC